MIGQDPLAERLEPDALRRPYQPLVALEERAEKPLVVGGDVLRRSPFERGEQGPARSVPPQQHERIVRDAHERRRENRRESDVVVAVVNEAQVGEEIRDLLLAEVAPARGAIRRETLLS